MRVKLGKRIYLCTVATHSNGSNLLILTTPNGIYTVDMELEVNAEFAHESLLKNGYFDFSECEYSN